MTDEPITKQNYAQRATAYGRMAGIPNGEYPVVNRGYDGTNWYAWKDYFRWIGMDASVDIMNMRPSITVPTREPEHFDKRFTREPDSIRQSEPEMNEDQRADRVRQIMAALRSAPNK